MNICVVTHEVSKSSGQGRVNYELVCEAIRQGHKVTILASCIDPTLRHNTNIVFERISVSGLPSALLKEICFSWIASRWLCKRANRFDIIKINGAIVNYPSDINAAHFIHSSWLECPYGPLHQGMQWASFQGFYQYLYTQLNSRWEKKAFLRAKKIVAVSKQIKEDLIKIGISRDKISVIGNGVDLEEFFPETISRKKLEIPENNVVALFAGDIKTSRKNLDTVLQSLLYVPSLYLVVLGSIEGSPYPKLASKLGIADRTYFLGHRRDISHIMKAVDLFVFPSRYEPYGLVILEALASGLPVITAKSVGASELITPECGVLLQDPNDVEELASAMYKLGTDQFLRLNMSKVARTIAEEHSWPTVAQNYLKLAKEIAAC